LRNPYARATYGALRLGKPSGQDHISWLGNNSVKPANKPSGRIRREQQRAIESRLSILEAALVEFAEKGFDGASTRSIGERAGVKQPLIAYHFGTKEALWKAVAEHFFSEIAQLWTEALPAEMEVSPVDRVRIEFRTFLRFTLEHPDFHHFMLRENLPGSPRLRWLAESMLVPTMSRILPQIRVAQDAHLLCADRGDLRIILPRWRNGRDFGDFVLGPGYRRGLLEHHRTNPPPKKLIDR
jgi:AcrR family transcriptional regulator